MPLNFGLIYSKSDKNTSKNNLKIQLKQIWEIYQQN